MKYLNEIDQANVCLAERPSALQLRMFKGGGPIDRVRLSFNKITAYSAGRIATVPVYNHVREPHEYDDGEYPRPEQLEYSVSTGLFTVGTLMVHPWRGRRSNIQTEKGTGKSSSYWPQIPGSIVRAIGNLQFIGSPGKIQIFEIRNSGNIHLLTLGFAKQLVPAAFAFGKKQRVLIVGCATDAAVLVFSWATSAAHVVLSLSEDPAK